MYICGYIYAYVYIYIHIYIYIYIYILPEDILPEVFTLILCKSLVYIQKERKKIKHAW